MHTRTRQRGFTIIEMLVAVALFATVMVIASGSLLSLIAANRKAHALQSVMNNLNTTVDSMVRLMRAGSDYQCGTGSNPDCTNGGTQLAFNGNAASGSNQYVYRWAPPGDTNCPNSNGCIRQSTDGGTNWVTVTAPEISITDMKFYVTGARVCQGSNTDQDQPKVVVVIKGIAAAENARISTTFHLQATAVQRVLDLPETPCS